MLNFSPEPDRLPDLLYKFNPKFTGRCLFLSNANKSTTKCEYQCLLVSIGIVGKCIIELLDKAEGALPEYRGRSQHGRDAAERVLLQVV